MKVVQAHAPERSLSRPMDVVELYGILVPIVAAIKCGHTGLTLPKSLIETFLLLPFRIQVLDGHIFVKRDLVNEDSHLEGLEISSINGMSARKIVAILLASAFDDGDVKSGGGGISLDQISIPTLSRCLG
jgi:hypothetical protein